MLHGCAFIAQFQQMRPQRAARHRVPTGGHIIVYAGQQLIQGGSLDLAHGRDNLGLALLPMSNDPSDDLRGFGHQETVTRSEPLQVFVQ